MSDGIHFSLANLPERYRAQVAQKLTVGGTGVISRPSPSNAAEGRSYPLKSGSMGKKSRNKAKTRKCEGGMTLTEHKFNERVLDGKGMFEAVSFRPAPKCLYTPDFSVWDENGHLTCYEVKGSYSLPSENRARFAFLTCRDKFRAVRFRWFRMGKDGNFEEQYGE